MSITMRDGLVDQDAKFKKRIASSDISTYKSVKKGSLVVGFPIDEGVLGFQTKYDTAAVSPAYDIWEVSGLHEVDRSYFERLIRSKPARATYTTKMRGTTNRRRTIPKEIFKKIAFPLPPLPEQRRIAAILDAADALRGKRRAALAELDALVQSTFLEMFGDPVTNPKQLPKETLESTFHFTTGKLDSNAAVEGGTYPFFTCAREDFAIDKYAFDCEALLLAGNNANADYSVKHYKGKFNAYQRTYVITINESLLTYEYARIALEYMLGDLKRFSKGSNTKYLTMVILNRMPILAPPLADQHTFSRILQSIEKQKAHYRTQLDELDTLFASLQQRAFNGEL